MRKLLNRLMGGAALALVAIMTPITPVFAQDAPVACRLTRSATTMSTNEFTIPGAAADGSVTASALADGVVNLMFANTQTAQALRPCAPQQVRDQLMQINGWQNETTIARGATFSYPVPDRATAVAAPPPPPAEPVAAVEQPAPQVVAAPPPPPARVVTAPPVRTAPLPAQVNLSEVRASIVALRAEDARLRQELAGIPTSQLTAEQLQLLNTLALIPNWEAKLRNLPENGVVQTASLPVEQRQAVQQVVATESLVESYVGRSALDWMTILAFLGVIALATFVIWSIRGRIKAVENNKVSEDDFAALEQRVTATENKVTELDERQFEHSVQKIADGEQRTLLPANIKKLKDGERFAYHLMVDGKVATYDGAIVSHTSSGDALVMVTEIGKPVIAKQLFAELCKQIENGGTVPYLKAA